MTVPESSREWAARLASVPTVARVLADHVGDLTPVATDQLRRYIDQLPLPHGWLRTQFDDPELVQPLRMAVRPNADGGWDGCETLAVFGFTGAPPSSDVLRQLTEQTLHGLGAENISASSEKKLPFDQRITRVRSSGEIDLAGQRVWLQHTIYLARAQPPEVGMLIEHTILVAAARRADLREDVETLSNRCYGAVASIRDAIRHPDAQAAFEAEVPTLRVQPYDDIGIPSILVSANRNGMRLLRSAVQSAYADGESSFEVDGIAHRIIRQSDSADMEIAHRAVTWRFGDAKLLEMLDLIEPLIIFWNPAHNYLDLVEDDEDPGVGVVEQLVLSVDEYVGSAPYGEFPELSTASPVVKPSNL